MQVEKTIKTNVEVLTIKPTEIDTFWPLVEFLIAEALKFSGMHLWVMFGTDDDGENKVFGCCTSRFFDNPNFKELQGLICTGKKMNLWSDKLVQTLEEFAKVNNCKRVTALMRPGYKKIMDKYNWKVKHYEFQKELTK